jgi:CPA2 family monovalent cation:H+ antiporter-2
MELSLFDLLIIVLAIAVLVVVLCKYLKIPPIIGYIVVGIIAGREISALFPDTESIQVIAEFGIVFLMFTIGLEFSLTRMIKMKNMVFGLGSAQIIFTGIFTAFAGHWLTLSWNQAITLACIVALSSTAIVSKQLEDQNELHSESGHRAISILLFQDLAVIPFFILISSFASVKYSAGISLFEAFGKTLATIVLIVGLGRWILRPLFKGIANTHSQELFTLSVLLVTVASAWITHRLGLTLAFGAFMAGMMLGETEFRHQIEASIRPFRDLLLGLFFITVGMLFNIRSIGDIWEWVLLLFLALTALKILIISVICRLAGTNSLIAVRTGIVLAQGGEFGFALLSFALHLKIFPEQYGQVILGALLLSMIVAPLFIYFNKEIAKKLLPEQWMKKTVYPDASTSELFTRNLSRHVIICGFGKNGQMLGKLLDDEQVSYIAIDDDLDMVNHCRAAGLPVIYGDSSEYAMLELCKIASAKAVVITFEEIPSIRKIIPQVRSHYAKLPIFVRTHDDSHLEEMQSLGATEVIPGSLETSLTLSAHVLLAVGISSSRVMDLIRRIRATRYRMLREVVSTE